MSYRCELCQKSVPPRQRLLRHITYRADGKIQREIPICHACKTKLDGGVPPYMLAEKPSQDIIPGQLTAATAEEPLGYETPRPFTGGVEM